MTPRQRLFAALAGAATDHVPVWLLFPYHPLSCYADVRRLPCYRAIVEAVESEGKAITIDRRHLGVRLFAAEVEVRGEESEADGVRVWRHILSYRGRSLIAEKRLDASGTHVQKLVRSAEDLEFFCSLPVNTDAAAIAAELDKQLPALAKERTEFPQSLGAFMLDLGEPICPLYQVSDLEEYAICMTLIGNIQYDDFRSFTPKQMREAVQKVLSECRGQRLILSPTAGPYEPEISPRMQENYLAFLDEAWRSPPPR